MDTRKRTSSQGRYPDNDNPHRPRSENASRTGIYGFASHVNQPLAAGLQPHGTSRSHSESFQHINEAQHQPFPSSRSSFSQGVRSSFESSNHRRSNSDPQVPFRQEPQGRVASSGISRNWGLPPARNSSSRELPVVTRVSAIVIDPKSKLRSLLAVTPRTIIVRTPSQLHIVPRSSIEHDFTGSYTVPPELPPYTSKRRISEGPAHSLIVGTVSDVNYSQNARSDSQNRPERNAAQSGSGAERSRANANRDSVRVLFENTVPAESQTQVHSTTVPREKRIVQIKSPSPSEKIRGSKPRSNTEPSPGPSTPRRFSILVNQPAPRTTPVQGTQLAPRTTPLQGTQPAPRTTPVQGTQLATRTTPVQGTQPATRTSPLQGTQRAPRTTPLQGTQPAPRISPVKAAQSTLRTTPVQSTATTPRITPTQAAQTTPRTTPVLGITPVPRSTPVQASQTTPRTPPPQVSQYPNARYTSGPTTSPTRTMTSDQSQTQPRTRSSTSQGGSSSQTSFPRAIANWVSSFFTSSPSSTSPETLEQTQRPRAEQRQATPGSYGTTWSTQTQNVQRVPARAGDRTDRAVYSASSTRLQRSPGAPGYGGQRHSLSNLLAGIPSGGPRRASEVTGTNLLGARRPQLDPAGGSGLGGGRRPSGIARATGSGAIRPVRPPLYDSAAAQRSDGRTRNPADQGEQNRPS